jgi:hypothetical protein
MKRGGGEEENDGMRRGKRRRGGKGEAQQLSEKIHQPSSRGKHHSIKIVP